MALCGNICFSGLYSDDVNVQGSKWEKIVWVTYITENSGVCAIHMWLNLDNKSYNLKKEWFTVLLIVLLQSCSCSLIYRKDTLSLWMDGPLLWSSHLL